MSAAKPYGCATWPRPTSESTYLVQDGYDEFGTGDQLVRAHPKWKRIKVFTTQTGCQYDKTATDPRCAACRHNPSTVDK